MKLLTKCHKMVWEFRRMMGEYWPQHGTVRSARHAVSEMGEVLNALERLEHGQEGRSRYCDPNDLSVLDELADVAMMILTAMGERVNLTAWAEQWADEEMELWDMYADLDEIDALTMTVKDFYAVAVSPQPSPISLASFGGLAVFRISEYAGMDLEKRLRQRVDRIFRKNHPDGQWLAKLEAERNGKVFVMGVDVAKVGKDYSVNVYQSERPGVCAVDDFAGYHPE